MDHYQQSIMVNFFKECSLSSPTQCHQFVRDRLLDQLFSSKDDIEISPSPYQGSMSYTCMAKCKAGDQISQSVVVQFRGTELDLYGNHEARRLHGTVVPLVIFRGSHHGVYVYTSPFAAGKPYLETLIGCGSLPLKNKLTTIKDLARIMAQSTNPAIADTHLPDSYVTQLASKFDKLDFQASTTRQRVLRSLSKIRDNWSLLAKLPQALSHPDLTPFNYHVEPTSGGITAVLDWDGAAYQPLGRNFHFAENLFGFMTKQGWEDLPERVELEARFKDEMWDVLRSQGYAKEDLRALEYSKVLGILEYYVAKMEEWRNHLAEMYLEGCLRHCSWEEDLV
ncbi:hypothetical protein L873DRAFT_1673471 [Choiromyces venosus 120613-1]|uniref:Aminoglycoside phosphotransferase domain-containing protein n=1 Tax=Choiromyces venosus 120613-1 TaxID=1336337 RepID=A0A3N4JZH1_9PEZI|nr:hypothetical protein L873DRAFT_1673471 [Choiromyces venosus 120613-1]